MEQKKETLFIVDGSYLLYRSFYAIRPLYTSTGIPTQATYGFARALKKIIDDFDPHALVIAWDSKGPTFRTQMYTQYKATRQAPPNELMVQKNDIIELVQAVGICQAAQPGFEADDVIYSLVHDHPTRDIVLVCPDKDLFQLLRPKVKIFDPFKGRLIDQATYEAEKGMPVAKIPFFYALLGDTSDNIPGVKGIGEKTALGLVNQFASLDDLYANLAKVAKERVRTLLDTQKDKAYLSLQLFSFKHCALPVTDADFAFDKQRWAAAAAIFKRLEFKSLLNELERDFPGATTAGAKAEEHQASLVTQTPAAVPAVTWQCILVETEAALMDLAELLNKAAAFAVDTETTGPVPLQDDLVGLSFAVDDERAYYIPVGHRNSDSHRQLPRELVLQTLKPTLENPKIGKFLQNAKFDHLVLSQYGITLAGVTFDTILAANLLRNAWQKINLKDLSQFFLGEPMQTYAEVVGKEFKSFADVPIDRGARYGAHDALQTFKLQKVLEKQLLDNPVLHDLFCTLELPLYPVLTKMEATGIALDVQQIKSVAGAVEQARQVTEQKFFAALEGIVNPLNFNLNSPKQIEWLLFDQLKLPVIKKSSKGQRSTDQEVLQELGAQSPVANLIARYRELTKLKSTYLDPLPGFINPKTGKIHTSYSQTMVATGRLSSAEPNLQNIPIGQEFGIAIRSAFKPEAGKVFLSADYSQIELRVLAHLCKDKNLVDAFLHDRDIHTQTAAQLFGVPQDTVTNQQRQLGKKINFSIVYGLTPFGLSKDLGIKPTEAKEYIEKYFAQYPGVARWIEDTIARATEVGYVQTLWGHRRYVPGLREKNKNLYEAERRIAINTPVQGTAADVMKLAMIKLDAAFTAAHVDAQLVLQIHDELVVQLHPDHAPSVTDLVRSHMEGVVSWDVPLKVTIRTGNDWGEVTK
jgi:DNA polymerase-1